jgi:hypothetical protein
MTDDTRGFINVIRDVLLREDAAGLSADGVPANNVGSGNIAGTPPDSPPGAAHRRRKRLAKAQSPKLFKALASEDHVELDLLSDAGQRRFDEGNETGAIDVKPEIDTDSADRDPNPKKKSKKLPSKRSLRRGPDAKIALNPVLPTRFEAVVDEDLPGGTPRIDMLIRLGLGDMKRIWYYRNAIKDPPTANKNPTLRPFVADVLEKLIDMIFRDQVLYNRVRALLTKSDHARGENELPEDADDVFERARFARWKRSRQLGRTA